jgi:symplekin
MCLKSDPHNPFIPKIQQYLERLNRSRTEIFDEASRKRAYEAQQYDAIEAKRQRLAAASVPQLHITPLSPGPHSVAEIFTLTSNAGLRGFDAGLVPSDIASRISVSTLARVDARLLLRAIEVCVARLVELMPAY